MKGIDKLEDLGIEKRLSKDLLTIFKQDNCALSQMLLIRLETMEKEGEIETPIVIHNVDKDDKGVAKELYNIEVIPTVIRYNNGEEIDREDFNNLTPDRFKELDLGTTTDKKGE